MFWVISISILLLAALVTAWPLLSKGSDWKAIGLVVVLLIPLGGALLYREFGEPLAIDHAPLQTGGENFNDLTDNLRSNLNENPEDLDGWLLLGRSLKSLQRYDEALEALQTAQRIAPDNPFVRVELAEAMLFASGNPQFSEEIRGMLQAAVNEEPGLQKGLWLLGIDSVQQGDDATAIDYWQRLLKVVEPNSPIAASVQEQINLALQRSGAPVPTPQADPESWAGLDVQISPGPDMDLSEIPGDAVLFVVVRPQGVAAGPPLGVARIDRPRFPVAVTIDDRNAMLPQSKLSAQSGLQLQARLSMAGRPIASPGDWESEVVEVSVDDPGPHPLALTTRVE